MSALPLHLLVLEVNVGLLLGRGGEELDAETITPVVDEAVGAKPLSATIIRGTEHEPTYYASYLVRRSDLAAILACLDAVSPDLGQEAIAVAFDGGGALVGPKACEWGPFNADYFQVPQNVALSA